VLQHWLFCSLRSRKCTKKDTRKDTRTKQRLEKTAKEGVAQSVEQRTFNRCQWASLGSKNPQKTGFFFSMSRPESDRTSHSRDTRKDTRKNFPRLAGNPGNVVAVRPVRRPRRIPQKTQTSAHSDAQIVERPADREGQRGLLTVQLVPWRL
jgi:hypothetical protein